ncbi:MAG: phosphomethylpyrimidine synthase ThiC, partial [Nitrospira sp. LK265]|nr:phosphomethylpyrimidine synthase ThiC [Nitrospira sp. LK265]
MSIQTNTNGSGHGNGIPTSSLTTTPFPASSKVYVDGTKPGVRVPMREISLTQTKGTNGARSNNASVIVYDTSGPYTDPAVTIDVRNGLTPVRRPWVLSRQDVDELSDVSSTYGRIRAADPKLAELRFQHIRKPLRAKPGHNVTQLHYARKGIVTPEMEFIAIRENQSRQTESEVASRNGHGGGVTQHPGFAWGAAIPL